VLNVYKEFLTEIILDYKNFKLKMSAFFCKKKYRPSFFYVECTINFGMNELKKVFRLYLLESTTS
jgi:hypothetical protein